MTTFFRHLDVTISSSSGEPEPHKLRKTLLKSWFVHSSARVQYEFRTYFWLTKAVNLTESTKDTWLEYVQRNLPEAVAMKVTYKERLVLPEAILKDIQRRKDMSLET